MSWTLQEISWGKFSPQKVPLHLIPLVKASSLVEYNALDYGYYLKRVFRHDPEFLSHIDPWVEEERKHGLALAQWVRQVDPSFDLEASLKRFQSVFRIPLEAQASIRGSNAGELMARCIVETGTSSFYSALGDATQEPVLKEICYCIASDEWRHYKLFYSHLKRYLDSHKFSRFQRLRIAYQRIKESESDELASAYYAANRTSHEPYHHKKFVRLCLGQAYPIYQTSHIQKACQMIAKASGLSPQGKWIKPLSRIFLLSLRVREAFLRLAS